MYFSQIDYDVIMAHRRDLDMLLELNTVPKDDWKEAYRIIRKFYITIEPKIIAENNLLFKAYSVPIWNFMNMVEQDFYHQYRSIGGIPIYPLYFVNGYYIDFANPRFKIGIEIDGKQYHDKEKDNKKDDDLAEFGWTIFRISARDVLKDQIYISDVEEKYPFSDDDDSDFAQEIRLFLNNYCTGFIYALRFCFYRRNKFQYDGLYNVEAFRALAKRAHNADNLYNLLNDV